jgi:DNA-binding NtrC family response regulator
MSLYLPPLRERVQDIGPLARHLAALFADRFHKRITGITPEALAALEAFPWPGNIRQLENAMQQAILLTPGSVLPWDDLPPAVRDFLPAGPPRLPEMSRSSARAASLADSRDQVERDAILRALVGSNFCRVRAAQALGVSRVTLYKKMKKHGLSEIRSAEQPVPPGVAPA